MPRIVRNFWITLDVDGKKTQVKTGPRSRGGGFSCDIQMRTDGGIHDGMIQLAGREKNGVLTLTIYADGVDVFTRTTKR